MLLGCLLPNYASKNGKLYAIGPAGETQELVIKGVNWYAADFLHQLHFHGSCGSSRLCARLCSL